MSANSANAFSFYLIFCEQHHLQIVLLATILCIYWSRLQKIEIATNINNKWTILECKNQGAVNTYTNASIGKKISFFSSF